MESGSLIKKVDKANSFSLMDLFMKDNGIKDRLKAKGL